MKSTKNLNIIKTKLPAKSAFTIPTEYYDLKLHQLSILTAKRGGGKTVCIANLMKHYKDKGYLDKVWVITPTYFSNKEIWDTANINEEDILDITPDSIDKVIKMVEQEKKDYDLFLHQKELYKKYQKDKHLDYINDDLLLQYDNCNFFKTKPTWKYKKEVPPRLALIIDDALNSPVMTSKQGGLINLCLRHRHLSGIGISIYMLVQSYVSNGGVPRCVRENTTSLLIFKTNDEKILQRLYKELDLEISYEKFKSMLDYAHSKEFNYLLIDFSPKEKHLKFRSGYNEIINT